MCRRTRMSGSRCPTLRGSGHVARCFGGWQGIASEEEVGSEGGGTTRTTEAQQGEACGLGLAQRRCLARQLRTEAVGPAKDRAACRSQRDFRLLGCWAAGEAGCWRGRLQMRALQRAALRSSCARRSRGSQRRQCSSTRGSGRHGRQGLRRQRPRRWARWRRAAWCPRSHWYMTDSGANSRARRCSCGGRALRAKRRSVGEPARPRGTGAGSARVLGLCVCARSDVPMGGGRAVRAALVGEEAARLVGGTRGAAGCLVLGRQRRPVVVAEVLDTLLHLRLG